jgi:serine/threonine protein kinase
MVDGREEECQRGLLPEAAILRRLCHPNVVQLLAAIDDPSADHVLLVMEFLSGGSLEQLNSDSGRCALARACMHA